MGIEVICRRDFNEFLPSGKAVGQAVQEIEAADDERSDESQHRAAQDDEQDVEQPSCLRKLRQPVVAQKYQHCR